MSAPSIPPTVDTSGLLAAGVILSLFTASVVSVRLAAGLHTAGKLNLDDCEKEPGFPYRLSALSWLHSAASASALHVSPTDTKS